ncbi:formyltransferase family protein [Kangiella sp. M94]
MQVTIATIKSLLEGELSQQQVEAMRCLVERKLPSFVQEMNDCYSGEASALLIKLYITLVRAIESDSTVDVPMVNCCLNLQDMCKKLELDESDSGIMCTADCELASSLKIIKQRDPLRTKHSELRLIRNDTVVIPSDFTVTVFAQNDRSVVAAYIISHLVKNGVNVNLLVTQKRFSKSSIRQELQLGKYRTFRRRLGKLIEKIIRKVKPESGYIEIRNVATEEGINSDLSKLCHDNKIPLVYVEGFNSDECHAALTRSSSHFGLYLGKEIVRKKTIELFEKGIVHNHPGRIPLYRGMDCVEWSLIQNESMHIGSSIQLLTPELDAGPVVYFKALELKPSWSINVIRSRVLYQGIENIINFFTNITKEIECSYYDAAYGRQYYVMHPKLKQLIKH